MSTNEIILLIWMIGFCQSCDLIECPMPCSCTLKNSDFFVNCSATGIDNTPLSVPKCDSATTLYLDVSHNTMKTLHIQNYASYSLHLDASYNRIDQIKIDKVEAFNIKELNLENNLIEKLDKSFRKLFNKCEKLRLRENPWHCDCDNSWLIKMLKDETDSKIVDIEDITCNKPSDKLDQKLKSVELDCPTHDGGMPPGQIAAIVVGIFFYLSISSVIGLCITMRRRFPVTSSE